MEKYLILWGKTEPYKPLLCHMIDAGVIAIEIIKQAYPQIYTMLSNQMQVYDDDFYSFVGYMIAMHDIGKCHPEFQLRQEVLSGLDKDFKETIANGPFFSVTPGFRHEKYARKVLLRLWKDKMQNKTIKEISAVIGEHHQTQSKEIPGIPSAYKTEYENLQNKINDILVRLFKVSKYPELCSDWSLFGECLNGLIIQADWLSSNTMFNFHPGIYYKTLDVDAYFEEAKKEAARVVKNIGYMHGSLPDIQEYDDLFHWGIGAERPIQQLTKRVTEKAPKMLIIEDIPGAGKTEAAMFAMLKMAFQQNKNGFYFAMPTAATSNQMYQRVNSLLDELKLPKSRLLHGTAWAITNEENEQNMKFSADIGAEWLQPSRKALLSQFAVGTVDQVMMAILNVKFRPLRMFGLINKVLVFDEVHAYDAYMQIEFERLLEWCGVLRIPVILLSATLPNNRKQAYVRAYTNRECMLKKTKEYPLITSVLNDGSVSEDCCETFRKTKYDIEMLDMLTDLPRTAEKAVNLVKGGGNLCLMVNTVYDAQRLYQLIEPESKKNGIELSLFHSRFKVKDRQIIENECLKKYSKDGVRPSKSILIATQVVEQSLDIDFDIIMTQICPIDLLIQRLGREYRHDTTARPEHLTSPKAYILTGNLEESSFRFVYSPYILYKTIEYLKTRKDLSVPKDFRSAIAFVYEEVDEDKKEYYDYIFNEQMKSMSACGVTMSSPDKESYYAYEEQNEPLGQLYDDDSTKISVKTRLGQPTIRVTLCDEDLYSRYLNAPQNLAVTKEILENVVTINKDISYDKMEQKGLLKGVLIIKSDGKDYILPDGTKLNYQLPYGAQWSIR